jgi:hypothetical protein
MTETLPPYSGDNPPCPKCAHKGAVTRYRAAGEHGSGDAPTFGRSRKGERLERKCWRCDYVWDEALNPPTPDATAGPTVREAAADDRRWPLEKHGE